MPETFTLEEARAALAELRPQLDRFVQVRADMIELQADLTDGRSSPLGGIPEAKAFQATLHDGLEAFARSGAEIKGWAPLLLDFPGERDGEAVLWCWLEAEPDIAWYHRATTGFAGRRRV
jgi:hypothetical protein